MDADGADNFNRSVISLAKVALALLCLWLVIDFFAESNSVGKLIAALRYGVPLKAVYPMQKRPHDCDFLTAPIGQKHCSYERDYRASWVTMSTTHEPIVYGSGTDKPPEGCSTLDDDINHRCYLIGKGVGGMQKAPTAKWHAEYVQLWWKKVED